MKVLTYLAILGVLTTAAALAVLNRSAVRSGVVSGGDEEKRLVIVGIVYVLGVAFVSFVYWRRRPLHDQAKMPNQ